MQVHTDWLLTPQRAAVHLPTATAVIADLHLGYELARQRRGEAVPARGLEETVAALTSLFVRCTVRRLVIAGDLFEDGACSGEVAALAEWLSRAEVEWLAVAGNHDRGASLCQSVAQVGGWQVVHGDARLPAGPVVHGHIHPCLRWGGRLVAPCFLIGKRRLVLPAFSADAAGVNVLAGSRWESYGCGVIAGDEVLDFGRVGELRRLRAARRGGPSK